MQRIFKSLLALAVGLCSIFLVSTAAHAQYGEDPPETVVIGVGNADGEGKFFRRYTAPDEIDSPYLIYVVGTDKDGEPFEFVVANVTPAFAGLSWTLNGIDMEPGSEYTLEARHQPGTNLATQVLGEQQLPVTGSNTRTLVGLAAVLTVIGGALVYGSRIGTRHDAAA